MKVAHEAPIGLLETVRNNTDYDYALVHLFEKYPEYYQFFEDSLDKNRTVILDNSLSKFISCVSLFNNFIEYSFIFSFK